MRLNLWDIEECVVTIIARLAGVSPCHITPDLHLQSLCGRAAVLDLIEIVEHEIGMTSAAGRAAATDVCTVWDLVTLFHRAREGRGMTATVRVGELSLDL